jgi:hypothetical protein
VGTWFPTTTRVCKRRPIQTRAFGVRSSAFVHSRSRLFTIIHDRSRYFLGRGAFAAVTHADCPRTAGNRSRVAIRTVSYPLVELEYLKFCNPSPEYRQKHTEPPMKHIKALKNTANKTRGFTSVKGQLRFAFGISRAVPEMMLVTFIACSRTVRPDSEVNLVSGVSVGYDMRMNLLLRCYNMRLHPERAPFILYERSMMQKPAASTRIRQHRGT